MECRFFVVDFDQTLGAVCDRKILIGSLYGCGVSSLAVVTHVISNRDLWSGYEARVCTRKNPGPVNTERGHAEC